MARKGKKGDDAETEAPVVDLQQETNANDVVPGYLVELAKSGRADCNKCGERIANKEVRVGVILEGEWGLLTRWQHLNCTVFHKSLTSATKLDGFNVLSSEDQDKVSARFQQSLKEKDTDFEPINPDELVRKTWSESMEPHSDLLMPLLPYQKEGLAWMMHQENSTIRGGILADEMGMGKTIQAIALILTNRPDNSTNLQKMWKASDDAHEWNGLPNHRGGTLIVLPTIAIRQWQMEFARFTREGVLKVKVYHGADRSITVEDLLKYDVILTSYKILEIEYRKATAGTKVECRICGKKFYPDKLRVHRKYFCGESAQLTAAQAKTQRKQKPSQKNQNSASESESETDDSIAKQKKKLKIQKVKVETKSSSSSTKAKKNSKKEDNYFEEQSSEDEITKQKKAIKRALSEHSASPGKTNKKKQPAKKRKSNESSDEESSDFGKPKKGSKKKKITKKKAYESSSEDSSVQEIVKKRRVSNSTSKTTKTKKGSKKSSTKKISEDSDSDDDYSDASEDSESEDSSIDKVPKRKGKMASKEVKMELNSSDDEQVERDIQEALLKHAKEMKKANAPKSIMHLVSWFRIILDEAHLIKDRSTSTCKAVFNLNSLYKWCLTGTPLQNRVGELYSLIRFLRIDPHAYYFCRTKDCSCKSLHYRFTKSKCDECGHSVISHFCYFNRNILNPIQRTGFIAEGRRAMLKLKQQILDEILLRRTKTTRADDIQLPMRIVKLRQEKLDEKEEDFYQALYTQSRAQFNTYLQSGTVLNNYAHIFDILIRLRQAVNHPYLVIHSDTKPIGDFNLNQSPASGQTNVDWSKELCDLCQEPLENNNPTASTCGHTFCRTCIMDYVETMKSENPQATLKCPDCNQPLTLIFDQDVLNHQRLQQKNANHSNSVWDSSKKRRKSILDKITLDLFQTSTKMEALMEELHRMDVSDYGSKAIVFSQFVNMLDLLEYRIQKGGIGSVKILGSMTIEQRDKAVTDFREDPTIKVLLISLKAGGVALNLIVANYIYLMDPWWNPAAEMQAIDRTHRIGQHKPIFATRFIIENSIEERIIKLQEKKKLVFDGTVGNDQGSITKLTVDDMRFLFQ